MSLPAIPDLYVNPAQFPFRYDDLSEHIEALERLQKQMVARGLMSYIGEDIVRIELWYEIVGDDYAPVVNLYYRSEPDTAYWGDDFPVSMAGVMTAEGIEQTLNLYCLQQEAESFKGAFPQFVTKDWSVSFDASAVEPFLQHVYGKDYPRLQAELSRETLSRMPTLPATAPINKPRM